MPGIWSRLLGRTTGQDTPGDGPDQGWWADPGLPQDPFGFEQPGFYSAAGIPVADPGVPLPLVERGNIERFWRTQPNLRKVVAYIARNAVVGLHVYERVSDTDRRRVTDSDLARLLTQPRQGVGPLRFWESVFSDGLLYDRWVCLLHRDPQAGGDWQLVQVPAWRTVFQVDPLRTVRSIWFWGGGSQGDRWVRLDEQFHVVYDYGYAPRTAGLSPVETLKDVLAEQAEAVKYRRQVWRNAGRATGFISRPQGAKWGETQRTRFVEWMRSVFAGDGPLTGGTILLEDGMTAGSMKQFSAQDMEDMEHRRLSAIEVASAYHIAPELVGAREGNYSNIDAFRQMMYGPSLGPYVRTWEQVVNLQVRPVVDEDRRRYVEANLEEKLAGSFIEQAERLSTATGAPWMTRNEARAKENMPSVPGGDELVTPLNVLVGGQASPRDSGEQNRGSRAAASATKRRAAGQVKAATEAQQEQIGRVLNRFFTRQKAAVLSALGAREHDEQWWDGDRWDRELAEDLTKVSHTIADILGRAEADRLGYPDDWDPDRTVAFLAAVAADRASGINTTTREQLDQALQLDIDTTTTAGDPAEVFDTARTARTPVIALSAATFLGGFASVEAARQVASGQGVTVSKAWVTGPNPRPKHAAMNGETVGVDEEFSNGQMWPGSAGGGPDDAGCNCSVVIRIEPR